MSGPNKTEYQIPEEMRDFAGRSVDQARKAFDGFMSAAHRAVDAAENSSGLMQSGMVDASRKAVDFAEVNLAASFAFAQKLVHASSIEEVIALQQNFMQSQMATLSEQAKLLQEAGAQSLAKKSSKRNT